MTEFWQWATVHWFLTFLVASAVISGIFRTINRVLRTVKVIARGWPTAPLMDADGDIVHPEKKS